MPRHALISIGDQLEPDYFWPGAYMLNGKLIGSPWVQAYYMGQVFYYEREAIGMPWIRVR